MANPQSVQSLDRAFDLLELLCQKPGGMLLSELSEASGLHKSTAHRLLATMIARGYVRKDELTNRFQSTFRLLEMASGVLDGLDILELARQPMTQLSEQTGETVHLVVRDGCDLVYVHKVESMTSAIRMFSRIGMRRPLFCTGVGKAILATLPDMEIADVWQASDIRAYTEHTIVTLPTFMKVIREIQKTGYALDNEENELGVRCVAAAIPDFSGHASTALSISAPLMRMSDERIAELVPLLLQCRDGLAAQVGYRKTVQGGPAGTAAQKSFDK